MYTVFCLKIYTPRPIKITPIVFYTLNFKKHNFSSTKKIPNYFLFFSNTIVKTATGSS